VSLTFERPYEDTEAAADEQAARQALAERGEALSDSLARVRLMAQDGCECGHCAEDREALTALLAERDALARLGERLLAAMDETDEDGDPYTNLLEIEQVEIGFRSLLLAHRAEKEVAGG
jgi:hypothetical protein